MKCVYINIVNCVAKSIVYLLHTFFTSYITYKYCYLSQCILLLCYGKNVIYLFNIDYVGVLLETVTYWLLVIGYWLLVIGYWLLVIQEHSHEFH